MRREDPRRDGPDEELRRGPRASPCKRRVPRQRNIIFSRLARMLHAFERGVSYALAVVVASGRGR